MHSMPVLRRATLAAVALPFLAHPAAVKAAPATDAQLMALALAIHAAEAALETACIRASHGADTPDADALEEHVSQVTERMDNLLRQLAGTAAQGALGLAAKGLIVATAVPQSATAEEIQLAVSLQADALRLFPVLGRQA